MKLRDLFFGAGVVGAGLLTYGAMYEVGNLVLEKRRIHLPNWPDHLAGFTMAVLGDLHVKDETSVELSRRAIAMALETDPDIVVFVGDFVECWKPVTPELLGSVLEPLLLMGGRAVAVPGNHDYHGGNPKLLKLILDELNIRLLRNEIWEHQGIQWVGIDSYQAHAGRPRQTMSELQNGPAIALWHEPDAVDYLPKGCDLMLSGHSHGGQFILPGGFTPKYSEMGRKYPRGFYPHAPTPLYVTRGVGTTFFPSRLNCRPEVSLLTLYPAEAS
jgi:predicted MPP superfamily phosphohydrolase